MITIETKIRDTRVYPALRGINSLLGHVARKLWVDLCIKRGSVAELKKEYLLKFGISGRHFNSVRYEVEGKYTGLLELNLEQRKSRIQAIAATEKSIAKAVKEAKQLQADVKALAAYRKAIARWREEKKQGRKGKKPKLAARLKVFVSRELEKKLATTRLYIHQKKRRLSILRHKLEKLSEQQVPSLCFGSKKLFNAQFHLTENGYASHAEWMSDWRAARNASSFWLGSHEESARNLNAQYDVQERSLSLRVPDALVGDDGETRILLEQVGFSYGEGIFTEAMQFAKTVYNPKKQREEIHRKPVSYRIIERTKGFYLQAIFEPELPTPITDKGRGAIGLDFNSDHIAMTEIDSQGNLVTHASFPFDTRGKSTAQMKALLGDHLAVICDYAAQVAKPIAHETLDFRDKKAALREQGGHRYAEMLSSFAYTKYQELLRGRAAKSRVGLLLVNPAFTSVVGYAKYFTYNKLSSHEKAAFVIARRALGLSERPKTSDARRGTVSILAPASSSRRGERHVWSTWRRNTQKIRVHMRVQPRPPPMRIAVDPRRASGVQAAFGFRCDVRGLTGGALHHERNALNAALQRYQRSPTFRPREAGCWLSPLFEPSALSRFDQVS